jgi:PEP-CTERM/exosortase A-associated glycosyltransferase
MPYVCGYSVRSDRILFFQREMGIDVSVVTSAQQPDTLAEDPTDPVEYFRTSRPRLWRSPVRELQLVHALYWRLAHIAGDVRADVIHAHSPLLVGWPAYLVARRCGLPFVYEVRDLWENASVDRGKFAADSFPYRIARGLETSLLRRADAVVTICEALRQELEARCDADAQTSVVPNGVDLDEFRPRDDDRKTRLRLGLGAHPLLAYAGAFQPYEGLEILIAAMTDIATANGEAHLLIAGDGPERSALETLTRERGLRDRVHFLGRIAHTEVSALYATADLLVYPRRLTRTTALTTPLKPLEAMAMGRCVLASDVPAMREIVQEGVTGALFRAGSAQDLAQSAGVLLADPERRRRLGAAAREWVARERDWRVIVPRYANVYDRAAERAQARPDVRR